MDDRLRVVIVGDHPLFREGVVRVLHAEPDVDVVGQGSTAAEAIQLATDLLPDIIMLDIAMPGGGVAAAQPISVNCPVTKIVILTASEAEDDVTAALKVGARAYVLKGVPARELVRILRAVWAGEAYVTPTLAISLLSEMSKPSTRSTTCRTCPPATSASSAHCPPRKWRRFPNSTRKSLPRHPMR